MNRKNTQRCAIALVSAAFIALPAIGHSGEKSGYSYDGQPPIIQQILKKEKSVKHLKNMVDMLDRLDATYGDLYPRLARGQKVVIFIDPAHGKMKNGKWEGESSGRLSCTGRTEEHYSLMLSRELYALIQKNKFIELKTTDNYRYALDGKSDIYDDIPFTETVALSKKANAFITISEHLNNVSTIHKASGLANLPGIHITQTGWGHKFLTYIQNPYKGFLTLYNKYDITGFSKTYSNDLKQRLVKNGFIANNWEWGTVGDDRFSYFFDLPVSVIFESGFLSNPEEEAKLADPKYQKIIVEAQYQAFLNTFRHMTGIDISGDVPKRINDGNMSLNIIKLSRIAVYYIRAGASREAIEVINSILFKYQKSPYKEYLGTYIRIKNNLSWADSTFRAGKNLVENKKLLSAKSKKSRQRYWANYHRGAALMRRAVQSMRSKSLYSVVAASLNKEYKDILGIKEKPANGTAAKAIAKPLKHINRTATWEVKRAPLALPFIVTIDPGQGMETSVRNAFSADAKTHARLMKSFMNAASISKIRVKGRARKGKKARYTWKTVRKKIRFGTGIYIVRLDRNLSVASARYVNRVLLDGRIYQNQQYLKNSYFAAGEKHKIL